MLQFNELRIDNNKHLIIDVEVITDTTLDPHQIIAIDHAYVGFGTNVISECTDFMNGVTSSSPEVIEKTTYDGHDYIRRVRFDIVLISDPIQLIKKDTEKTLVYVKITTETGDIDVPCSISTTAEGFVYDRCLLVNKVLGYISQSDNKCANTNDYANYIVQSEGLELAVQTGDFMIANMYWNKFFSNQESISGLTHNCGCRCH